MYINHIKVNNSKISSNTPNIVIPKFLAHFDGINGGTSFPDVHGHSVTGSVDATTTTSNSKFGTASLQLNGDSYVQYDVGTSLDFGVNNFTVDYWVNTTDPGFPIIVDHYPATPPYSWQTGLESTGMYYQVGGTVITGTATSVADGNWHHLAYVRYNFVTTLYFDGVATGSGSDTYDMSGLVSTPLTIGQQLVGTPHFYTGLLDELHITSGAMWTSNFIPPSSPYIT